MPQRIRLLMLFALAAAVSCSVYDASLLAERRTSRANLIGARAFAGAASTSPIAGRSAAAAAGGGGQSGIPAAGAPATPARCGDGRVDPGESCDTGVLPGSLGACPTSCDTGKSCERALLIGSGCSAQCVPAPLGCLAADGCCPPACTSASDSDCSSICGDGVVQTERGEICEPNPDAGATPCPQQVADCDDGDACTADALSGSAANCNAQCTHEPVRTPRDKDGCCPTGANSSTDSDCAPICGNGVREGAEACDGNAGCDTACQLVFTSAQLQCLEQFDASDCDRCQCANCTDELLACRSSGDAARDAACTEVERCATEEQCAGDACYCGSSSSATACALNPNGPCQGVIEGAAGSSLGRRVQEAYEDANSALGRARALGECRRQACASACPGTGTS